MRTIDLSFLIPQLSAMQAHVYALVACYERTEATSADMEEGAYQQLCMHVAGLHSGASAPSGDSLLGVLKGLMDYAFQVGTLRHINASCAACLEQKQPVRL